MPRTGYGTDAWPNIRNELKSESRDDPEDAVTDTDGITDGIFDTFQSVTDEEMQKVVAKLSGDLYQLFPTPTEMLKTEFIRSLSPVLVWKLRRLNLS